MVVLADEILESFFDADLSASFRLEPVLPLIEQQQQKSGFLGGLVSSFLSSEDNRRILNNVADQIGKTIGKHQVIVLPRFRHSYAHGFGGCTRKVVHRPSIGKYDKNYGLQEPKLRESLLTSSVPDRPPSGSSLSLSTPETALASDTLVAAAQFPSSLSIEDKGETPITPIVQQLANVMERKPFAIDEARDDGRIDDDLDSLDGVGEDDKLMMDEVRPKPQNCDTHWGLTFGRQQVDAFLEAHDSGLTNAENEAAKGMYQPTLKFQPLLTLRRQICGRHHQYNFWIPLI